MSEFSVNEREDSDSAAALPHTSPPFLQVPSRRASHTSNNSFMDRESEEKDDVCDMVDMNSATKKPTQDDYSNSDSFKRCDSASGKPHSLNTIDKILQQRKFQEFEDTSKVDEIEDSYNWS